MRCLTMLRRAGFGRFLATRESEQVQACAVRCSSPVVRQPDLSTPEFGRLLPWWPGAGSSKRSKAAAFGGFAGPTPTDGSAVKRPAIAGAAGKTSPPGGAHPAEDGGPLPRPISLRSGGGTFTLRHRGPVSGVLAPPRARDPYRYANERAVRPVLETRGLRVPQLHLPKAKNGDPRAIPLNAVALGALKRLRGAARVEETDPIFPSLRTVRALQGPPGWSATALEEAEIEGYTWHCNRHTFASRLVMTGVDLRTVAELLGHRTLQMVMRYSHLAPEYPASAVDRLVDSGNGTDTKSETSAFQARQGKMDKLTNKRK